MEIAVDRMPHRRDLVGTSMGAEGHGIEIQDAPTGSPITVTRLTDASWIQQVLGCSVELDEITGSRMQPGGASQGSSLVDREDRGQVGVSEKADAILHRAEDRSGIRSRSNVAVPVLGDR